MEQHQLSRGSPSYVFQAALAVCLALCGLLLGGCGAAGEDESVESTSQAVCAAVSLSAPTTAQPIGSTILLSASEATCAVGETPQYRFLARREGTTINTVIQDWSSSRTASWDTTGLSSGRYDVTVGVRPVGSTGNGTIKHATVYIGDVCTSASVSGSPASPQNTGTMVTVTAAASCSGGTPEYQFTLLPPNSSTYVLLQDWSTTATYNWDTTSLTPGNYRILVYTRAAGNLASDSSGSLAYKLNTSSIGGACTAVSGSVSPTAPVAAGTMVTISATASGCTMPEYAFYYRLFGQGTYTLLRDFGSSSVTWDTSGLAGTYQILVQARGVGSSTIEATSLISAGYAVGGTCPTVELSASLSPPQVINTQVTLSASATCTGGTPEYQFWAKGPGDETYVELRGWASSGNFVWNTMDRPSGAYTLAVYARAAGNSSAFEGSDIIAYSLVSPGYTSISASLGYHTCASDTSGRVYCWGLNDTGQLGDGSNSNRSVPVQVSSLTNVSRVVTGGQHSCALLNDQTVRCWGDNSRGQLGNGTTTSSNVPVAVSGISNATAISAGQEHSCALLSDGTLSCWGNNSYSQMAETKGVTHTTPIAVPNVTGVAALASGAYHQCVLLSGGEVSCWGYNGSGQVGDGTTTERRVPLTVLSGVTQLSAGDSHTCAVSGGSLSCWGDNTYGQLGDGTTTNRLVPTSIGSVSGVSQAAPGFPFTCARSSGTVQCWGHGDEGELGNGFSSSTSPVSVSGLSGVSTISAGALHSCVLLSNGTARCWGYNQYGQLGNGSTADAGSPVVVLSP